MSTMFPLSLSVNPKLQDFYLSGRGSNLIVRVKKQSTKCYRLHKEYLTLESSFFAKECEKNIKDLTLNVEEIEIFELILKCFYGFNVKFLSNQMLNAFKISELLEIETLQNQITDHFISNTNEFDLIDLWIISQKKKNEALEQKVIQRATQTNYELLNQENVYKLDNNSFIKLVASQIPNFKYQNRIQVYQLIIKYCNLKGSSNDNNQSEENKQNQIFDILFQLIDPKLCTADEYKIIFHQPQFYRRYSVLSKTRKNNTDVFLTKNQSNQTGITNNNFIENPFDKSWLDTSIKFVNSTAYFDADAPPLFQDTIRYGLYGESNPLTGNVNINQIPSQQKNIFFQQQFKVNEVSCRSDNYKSLLQIQEEQSVEKQQNIVQQLKELDSQFKMFTSSTLEQYENPKEKIDILEKRIKKLLDNQSKRSKTLNQSISQLSIQLNNNASSKKDFSQYEKESQVTQLITLENAISSSKQKSRINNYFYEQPQQTENQRFDSQENNDNSFTGEIRQEFTLKLNKNLLTHSIGSDQGAGASTSRSKPDFKIAEDFGNSDEDEQHHLEIKCDKSIPSNRANVSKDISKQSTPSKEKIGKTTTNTLKPQEQKRDQQQDMLKNSRESNSSADDTNLLLINDAFDISTFELSHHDALEYTYLTNTQRYAYNTPVNPLDTIKNIPKNKK